jgi:hypothetical protein
MFLSAINTEVANLHRDAMIRRRSFCRQGVFSPRWRKLCSEPGCSRSDTHVRYLISQDLSMTTIFFRVLSRLGEHIDCRYDWTERNVGDSGDSASPIQSGCSRRSPALLLVENSTSPDMLHDNERSAPFRAPDHRTVARRMTRLLRSAAFSHASVTRT